MKNIIVLLLLSIILFACEEDTVQIELEDQVVVEAFMHAEQPLDSIQLFKVTAYTSDEVAETIDDALVSLQIDGTAYDLLALGSEGYYELPDIVISAGQVLELNFEFADQIVSASTSIPEKPLGLTLSAEEISLTKIEDFTDIQNSSFPDPVEISWDAVAEQYYFLSIENIETNPEQVNELFDFGDSTNVQISTRPDITGNYFMDTRREISQFGTYRIVLFSVNPEYAALFEEVSNESTSLGEPPTNIINGKGIFTGINSDTTYLEVNKM